MFNSTPASPPSSSNRSIKLLTLATALCFPQVGKVALQAEEPVAKPDINLILQGLEHPKYGNRERAQAELTKLGPEAKAELEIAARTTTSDEMRARLNRHLDGLRAIEQGKVFNVDDLTICGEEKASVHSAVIAKAIGHRIRWMSDKSEPGSDPVVALEYRGSALGALQFLAEQTGRRVEPSATRNGREIILAPTKVNYRTLSSNPRPGVVADNVLFLMDGDVKVLKKSLEISFQVLPDPRLPFATIASVDGVRAVLDSGEQVSLVPGTFKCRTLSNVSREVSISFEVTAPVRPFRRIAKLELRPTILAFGDRHVLNLEKLPERTMTSTEMAGASVEALVNGRQLSLKFTFRSTPFIENPKVRFVPSTGKGEQKLWSCVKRSPDGRQLDWSGQLLLGEPLSMGTIQVTAHTTHVGREPTLQFENLRVDQGPSLLERISLGWKTEWPFPKLTWE